MFRFVGLPERPQPRKNAFCLPWLCYERTRPKNLNYNTRPGMALAARAAGIRDAARILRPWRITVRK